MSAKCRACPAGILWAKRPDGNGKPIPLDTADLPLARADDAHVYAVVPAGRDHWAYRVDDLAEKVALKEAVSTARARDLVLDRYELHESHFRTCVAANRFSGRNR